VHCIGFAFIILSIIYFPAPECKEELSMTTEELYAFASTKGCKCVGNRMMGTHRGYPFVTTLIKGSVLNTIFQVTGGEDKAALKRARKELPRGCSLARSGVRMVLSCTGKDPQLMENYIQSMNITTTLLQNAGAAVPTVCPLCARGGCDAFGLRGDCYVPVHRACYEAQIHSTVSSVEQNTVEGTYLKGWIGAVLGGIVGAIPAVLCQVFLNYFVALAFALIPLGAYYGYRKLGGKMDRMVTVATVVVSLAQIFGSQFMTWYASLIYYWGELPAPGRAIEMYFGIMDEGDILENLAYTVLFILLGLWIVSRQIRQTNHTAASGVGVMMESLTDRTPADPQRFDR